MRLKNSRVWMHFITRGLIVLVTGFETPIDHVNDEYRLCRDSLAGDQP